MSSTVLGEVPASMQSPLLINRQLFSLTGANLNTTADQALTKAFTFTNHIIDRILITNASADLTLGLAAGGFYTAAITASMQQWGVGDAAIAAYLAQPAVAYAGGVAGLKQIAREKFVALYGDGGNAWAEWRRTCVPSIAPGPAAVVNYIPRRFYYPPGEASVNATNLNAAIARQGADNFATRVYFDTKPTAAPTCS